MHSSIIHESTNVVRPTPVKRRKVQQACQLCRDRKTRCDGRQPVCIACEKRGLSAHCVYDRAGLTSQKYISHLESRLQELSQPNLAVMSSRMSGINGQPIGTRDADINEIGSGPPEWQPSLNSAISGHPTHSAHDGSEQTDVDGLATLPSADDHDGMYGESSTIAFTRRLDPDTSTQKSPIDSLGNRSLRHMYSGVKTRPITLERIRDKDESAALIPRRRNADDYLQCFWEMVHPVFPIIHKQTFITRYHQIWSPEEVSGPISPTAEWEESIFYSSLNLTFALGCQYSKLLSPHEKSSAAEEFYRRARRLFVYDVLDSRTLPVVQMLLLSGVYLQSTGYASRCWNIVGLAIRAAQSIGLDKSHIDKWTQSQLDREIKRRIWHSCVTLDRLLAMTFGRSTMTSGPSCVPVPLMIDDEYLRMDCEGTQPEGTSSSMDLFVYSCRLFDILDEILSTFYRDQDGEAESSRHRPRGTESEQMLPQVLAFNRRLDNYLISLPAHLSPESITTPSSASGLNKHLEMHTQLLYSRFLLTRVLLLRPLLLLATETDAKFSNTASLNGLFSLDGEMHRQACHLCLLTAEELLKNVYQNLGENYRISGWHSVYQTFAAAIVLLAAQKCTVIDSEADQRSTLVAWDQCFAILKFYSPQIHSAGRASSLLKELKDKITISQEAVPGDPTVDKRSVENGCNTTSTDFAFLPDSTLDREHVFMRSNTIPSQPSRIWQDMHITDSLADSWFNQHLVNLDWAEALRLSTR